MSNAEILLRTVQSILSSYGAFYLLSAFGLPLFYLRHLSLDELHERKSSKWRLWAQGLATVLAVGFLVWSAAYAIISVIPYDWGSHDEDGEWQATRDAVRVLITAIGAPYLSFSMDRIARALAIEKFLRALVRGDPPEFEIEASMRRFHRNLSGDHNRKSYWITAEDREFSAAFLRTFETTINAYGNKDRD